MALRSPATFRWKGNCFQNLLFRTHLLHTHAVQQVACLHRNAHFQQYCVCGRTGSYTPKVLETSHRLFYSTNPNPEYGAIKRGWMKVSAMIKAFMSGTKALYRDMRQSFDLRVKKGGLKVSTTAPTKDFPFSRKELRLIYEVSILGSCTGLLHSLGLGDRGEPRPSKPHWSSGTVVHVCACLFGPTIYQISRFNRCNVLSVLCCVSVQSEREGVTSISMKEVWSEGA